MNYNLLVTGSVLLGVIIMIRYLFLWRGRYKLSERPLLEFRWIILPSLLTLSLLLPTLNHLYYQESEDRILTLKRVGHQWYWRYNYSPFDKEFDSFLGSGTNRLLDRDNKVVLPFSTPITVSVTSEDVLHSWALPLLNIKIDANPGRLNRMLLRYEYPGSIYGQCSEICGANHSFIPIDVEFTSSSSFLSWLRSSINKGIKKQSYYIYKVSIS